MYTSTKRKSKSKLLVLCLLYRLSDTLLEKETIDFKVVYDILGPKPFEPKESFKRYLDEVLEKASGSTIDKMTFVKSKI